jgi:PAS domain S-box-containing protein
MDGQEQFRLAIEAAPTGMIMVSRDGRIVMVNAQVETLFGYRREELIGRSIEILVPERSRQRHPELRTAFFSDPKARPLGAGRDLYGLRKDGSEVPVEIGLTPIQTAQGDFVLTSVVDITDRKRAEQEREELLGRLRTLNLELEQRVRARTAELTATLKEREVLLQEVHHRVKNNLQVIASLIGMQARLLEEGGAKSALEECRSRVEAIALIHEKLYQSKDYARVPFSEYARSVAASVFEAGGSSRSGVSLQFAIQDVALAVDKAIPCGLILNELVTNALKHAFRGRPGTVRVELTRVEGGVRLAVSDDGVGLPAGLDVRSSESLGLQLVRMLAKQVGGDLRVEVAGGTCFRLTVPIAG